MDKNEHQIDPRRSEATQKLIDQFQAMSKDKELAILKCHLLIEELLRDYCAANVANADALRKAKLTFSQVMHLAQALTSAKANIWIWDAMNNLNQLRNKLAHALSVDESYANRELELTRLIMKNMPDKPSRTAPLGADKFAVTLGMFYAYANGLLSAFTDSKSLGKPQN